MSALLIKYNAAKVRMLDGYHQSLLEIDESDASESEKNLLIDQNETKTIAELISYAACLQAFVECEKLSSKYEQFRLALEAEIADMEIDRVENLRRAQ
jgi:hypothetical protein